MSVLASVSAGSMPSTLNLLPAAATVSCVQLESGVSRESAAAIAAAPEHLDGLCRSTGVLRTGWHRRRKKLQERAGSSTLRDGHSEKVCHAAVREPAAALARHWMRSVNGSAPKYCTNRDVRRG